MEKKLFKYYAIRYAGTVVFRRTVAKIKRVKSVLYKPGSEFNLQQVTYIGGQVVGSMSYSDWARYGGRNIGNLGCVRVTRDNFRALSPYVQKG